MVLEIILVILIIFLIGLIIYFALSAPNIGQSVSTTVSTAVSDAVAATAQKTFNNILDPIFGSGKMYVRSTGIIICGDYDASNGNIYAKLCEPGDKQKFVYNTATKQIMLGGKDKCLVPRSNGTITVAPCSSDSNQQFNTAIGSVKHVNSGKCLDYWEGGFLTINKQLGLYQCNGQNNQDIWFQNSI